MDYLQRIDQTILTRSSKSTDNFIFRLHYRYTILMLVLFGCLSTSYHYFGTTIECNRNKGNFGESFINQYCWTHSTFVLSELPNNTSTIYYGMTNSNGKTKRFNSYYQWVAISMFSQAIILYLPRFIWKNYERMIISNLFLDEKVSFFDDSKRDLIRIHIIRFLMKKPKICSNRTYFLHIITEILNLIIVVLQFVFMNYFLGMNFMDYGYKVLTFNSWSYENYFNYFDPMTRSFPKMVKCIFYDVGAAGGINRSDYLCILPLNVINAKIYLFLWFWFQLLMIFSLINLIYRFLLSFSNGLRLRTILIGIQFRRKQKVLASILSKVSIGEWFVLNILNEYLDDFLFDSVMDGFYAILIKSNKDSNQEKTQV